MQMKRWTMALALCVVSAAALAADLAAAERAADKMADAFLARNYQAIVALTHPTVVKVAGGPDATAKKIEQANAELTYTSMKFGKPQQISDVGSALVGIFPYHSNITYRKQALEVNSFFIGISTDKRTWKFIDCEGVTQPYLAQLIPGYQNNLELKGC